MLTPDMLTPTAGKTSRKEKKAEEKEYGYIKETNHMLGAALLVSKAVIPVAKAE